MQSIIIYFFISIICSIILSNFLVCASEKKGNDFNIKDYISRFKIKNIDMINIFIFFILFVVLSQFNNVEEMILYVPLCFSLMLAFCMDIKYMIIPDTSNIVIAICGIIKLALKFSLENIINCILGFLVGGLFFYVINIVFKLITKKIGFGFGDIKLLAALGIFYGYKGILVLIIMSIFISAIFSIGFLVVNAINKKSSEYLPFGPFIVISSVIISVVPVDKIINMYFSIIDNIVSKML